MKLQVIFNKSNLQKMLMLGPYKRNLNRTANITWLCVGNQEPKCRRPGLVAETSTFNQLQHNKTHEETKEGIKAEYLPMKSWKSDTLTEINPCAIYIDPTLT